MTHATKDYIGHDTHAPKTKTAKTIYTNGRLCRVDEKNKRCAGNQQGQTKISTTTDVANGFLTTTFLPKLEDIQMVQPAMETKKTENDFYDSLASVVNHYGGFEPIDTSVYGYPYNIVLSVWDLESHLKRRVNNWKSISVVRDDKGKTFIMSEERYDTGTTLYYIPVLSLYKMLNHKKTRKAALLLLSVFAYLYHVARIPYYRQEDSYIYWQHEMIADWIEQDDEAELNDRKAELELAAWCGDRIEQKIFNRKNLDVFVQRIKTFRAKDDVERACLQVAKDAFTLFKDYPDANVFMHTASREDDSMEEEDIITMEKYISFVATTKGWLYETLAECINSEFNECGITQEPAIVKHFDAAVVENEDLSFESQLFPLINDLCSLLHND